MNYLIKNIRLWLVLIITIVLSGCLKPYNPTRWTAVAIFNDIEAPISYQLLLSGKLTPPVKIESGQFDYVLEYGQNIGENSFDEQLTEITLLMSGCRIKLERTELLKEFKKDTEGRNTWDMHVNRSLLRRYSCKKLEAH